MQNTENSLNRTPFSFLDHITHPFSHVYSDPANQKKNKQKLHVVAKIGILALALFAVVSAKAHFGNLAGGLIGLAFFYGMTAATKIKLPEKVTIESKKINNSKK